VDRIVDALLERGRIARGYLGVGLQPVRLSETLRRSANSTADTGLLVTHVDAGGPAERAGILLGDVVMGVEGKAVRDLRDVAARLGPESVSRVMEFAVIRGGVQKTVSVEVGERPEPEGRNDE
jgi:S1-C subfamily serine protease